MKIGTIPVLPVADYITIFLYDGKVKKYSFWSLFGIVCQIYFVIILKSWP